MVIDRHAWRVHGDLLEWLATGFPGLSNAQFEAGYRLLADPDISDVAAEQVAVELRPQTAATLAWKRGAIDCYGVDHQSAHRGARPGGTGGAAAARSVGGG